MIVTSSSARIIEDVDRSLEAFLIVLSAKGSAVEGTVNINGHRRKEVCEGRSFILGGARTKGESHE